MGQPEQFSLKWGEFEETMSGGLRELRAAQQLEDVTLIVEGGELKAHRVVLASCSSFFRRILVSCSHQAPLLYLRGVPKLELASMLDFMYQGEVSIGQDRLAAFLAVAEDLQVKGLTNSDPKDTLKSPSPVKTNRRKMHFSPSGSCSTSGGKKARVGSPLPPPLPPPLTPRPTEDSNEDSIVVEDPIIKVKSEPVSNSKEGDGGLLSKQQLLVKAGESSRDGSDFSAGFGGGGDMTFSDYSDDPSSYDHGDQHDYGSSFTPFPFVTSEQEQVRNRRQLILQFITANKGRLSDTYVCLICNKQVTDNSNMNKHLEFKHGSELKLFLQSLAL